MRFGRRATWQCKYARGSLEGLGMAMLAFKRKLGRAQHVGGRTSDPSRWLSIGELSRG